MENSRHRRLHVEQSHYPPNPSIQQRRSPRHPQSSSPTSTHASLDPTGATGPPTGLHPYHRTVIASIHLHQMSPALKERNNIYPQYMSHEQPGHYQSCKWTTTRNVEHRIPPPSQGKQDRMHTGQGDVAWAGRSHCRLSPLYASQLIQWKSVSTRHMMARISRDPRRQRQLRMPIRHTGPQGPPTGL